MFLATLLMFVRAGAELPEDTVVYYGGGNRGHIESCRRFDPKNKTPEYEMTLAEMRAKGGMLCSRCPGSELNQAREAEAAQQKEQPRRDPKPEASEPGVAYDPSTPVYLDALWFRAHAADCPELLLKDQKKTMTLAEADKAGARIGESGQSGRDNCCLQGYKRKYPAKTVSDDTLLGGDDNPRRWKHIPGCHRYWPDRSHVRRPKREWIADGFGFCPHCIERGPSLAVLTDEAWNNLPDPGGFTPPEGWEPRAFSMDAPPSQQEVEMLIQETLSRSNGIQELQFSDPVAAAENFVTMRFFFPVSQWLDFYKAYRATGDRRVLAKLHESARHYHDLSRQFPSVAQKKAADPEGMAFMYSMAAWSRFTLQHARKHPGQANPDDVAEAEAFLRTMVAVLEPICEGNENLDPEMGIPRALADDFRSRAFNRSMNGIGTLSMITAALEDLQALKGTKAYQPTIDRYRKTLREYISYWQAIGHLCEEIPGEPMFVYPYKPEENPRVVDGCKIYRRAEDGGHYSHTLQGLMCMYESTPEVGVDEAFMTAVANAVHYGRTTKITRGGREEFTGHFQCPTALRVSPQGGERVKGHPFERGTGGSRFHMLEAFRSGVIEALGTSVGPQQVAEANRGFEQRLAMLHAQYLKALGRDRSLVHLGGGR